MAISMKDVDPSFQGVGQKAGTEIWRIEKSHGVAIPMTYHGKLCLGQSYVILQTTALKSGVFHHDIHYWLGRSSTQDEAAAMAVKAVELDAALGGHAVLFREVAGHETDKFLSYFKPCFIPTEENVPSGVNNAERRVDKNHLFLCKGRHVVHVKEVPFTRSSLSHNDVFVLDTESKIFQFNGANTDIHERAKALDVVQYLKENFHKKECQLAVIEDGKFVADADSGEFWGLFGGFAPLGRKFDGEHNHRTGVTTGTLFCVQEGQVKKMEELALRKETLITSNCYIVDCGAELFVWMGRDTLLEARKATILIAEELVAHHQKPNAIHLTCVIEGFEPREFKSKFKLWPISTSIPISEDGRGKVAVLLKQKGFNVKGILKAEHMKEQSTFFNSAGKLQVWCINGSSKECIPSSEHGKFYNNNCYTILYTYSGNQKEEYIVCCWLGHQSTMETQASAAQNSHKISSSLQGDAVEVRIFEGNEPTQFLSLFDKLYIMKGDKKEDKVKLFQIDKSGPHSWRATQVDLAATSLNSSGCFFLQMENSFLTWYGKFSTSEEQEATENMALYLKPDASTTTLREGSELEQLWDALGGKKVYPSHREPRESAKDAHLFSCTLGEAQLKVTEVFNFSQEDLLNDEIMILDCHTEVFVWVGRAVDVKHRFEAIKIGQKYLEHVAVYEGMSLATSLYKIIEGSEPWIFTSFFSWDPSKVLHHLNPFQRKLLVLTGESLKATEVTRSRRLSSLPDSKKEGVSVADKNRFGRNFTFKTEYSRIARTKPGGGRQPSRSAAVSALSSMFEFQTGGNAPPNTPIVSLPALSLKTKEQKKESPFATSSLTPSPRTPRTPREVASPRSPAIAALTSIFESYSDKRLDFAWPGVQLGSEEKGSSCTATTFFEDRRGEEWEGRDGIIYPYERVKVSSSNPVTDIDGRKRETYLSSEEFQELFLMDRETFYKLPKWKQDKYKLLLDLF